MGVHLSKVPTPREEQKRQLKEECKSDPKREVVKREKKVTTKSKACRKSRTERYAVIVAMKANMIAQLGVEQPKVEAFADADLHTCKSWWGPGSTDCMDAFSRNWAAEGLIWCNPPLSQLGEVV